MLHITNGDSAAGTIRETGLDGDVLPWRDVLHEGPVPGGLALEALSEVRSGFLAGAYGEDRGRILQDFRRRDARLAQASPGEAVVLWFEADLYDQLQLLQLLHWFRDHRVGSLDMICIGEHPEVPNFHGLGELNAGQMAALFPQRVRVTPEQLALGAEGWDAFTQPSPDALDRMAQRPNHELPFLSEALVRLLEDYPAVGDGLGRTERQILQALVGGADDFSRVFRATQETEERVFMGDSTLWDRIEALAEEPSPALLVAEGTRRPGVRLQITTFGRACLGKKADLVREHGIRRWIGGVEFHGHEVSWRWNPDLHCVVPA